MHMQLRNCLYKRLHNCKDRLHMKHLYNFRLDISLVKAVDKLPGTRTSVVTNALQQYLQDNGTVNHNPGLNDMMKNYIDHLNSEILYLRELHQGTMTRVLQIPQNTAYNQDPIVDLQQSQAETMKDQSQANIITKLGNVITDYKNNNHRFL